MNRKEFSEIGRRFFLECQKSAVQGDLKKLKMYSKIVPIEEWPDRLSYEASKHGHFHIVRWMVKNHFSSEMICGAIAGDQDKILKWLLSSNLYFSEKACLKAVNCQNKKALRRLWNSNPSVFTWRSMEIAVSEGNLEIAKWLVKKDVSLPRNCYYISPNDKTKHYIHNRLYEKGERLQECKKERCRWCNENRRKKMWRLWSKFKGEGEYTEYLQYPPEEVLLDIDLLIKESQSNCDLRFIEGFFNE
jgi:hypothetical protein